MGYQRVRLRLGRIRLTWLPLTLLGISAVSTLVFFLAHLPDFPKPIVVTATGVSATGAVTSAIAAVITLIVTQVRESRKTWGQQRESRRQNLGVVFDNIMLSDPKRGCPLVRAIDNPALIGVSRSLLKDDGTRVDAEYFRRDVHDDVLTALRASNFVLLIGDSKSGKSRTAFECVKELYGSRLLVSPVNGPALRKLVTENVSFANTVVWLDDLDRFLANDGLDQAVVSRLLSSQNCSIVATMRSAAHAALSPKTNQNSVEWQLVQLARSVRLSRLLSPNERNRLPKSLGALVDRHGSLGLAEFLSGATDLLDRYRDAEEAFPAGWALTRGAIELVLCGLRRPGIAMVQAAASTFLPKDLTAAEKDAAWKWALERIYGASALLSENDESVRPFDYLLDKLDGPVSPQVWALAARSGDARELAEVGAAALVNGKLDVVRTTQLKLASIADGRAKAVALYLLAVVDRIEGHRADAIRNARASDRLGHALAPFMMGELLLERKRRREAATCFRRAFERGFPLAAYRVAQLARREAEVELEREYLQLGADAGDADCRLRLAELHKMDGNEEEAEKILATMAKNGHPLAAAMLGDLMIAAGKYAESLVWYEAAAAAGAPNGAINAGFVNELLKKPEVAERWYRQAAEQGHPKAELHLGCLCVNLKRYSEAEQLLEPLAKKYVLAADRLSMMYIRQRRLDRAHEVLEAAAIANLPGMRHCFAKLCEAREQPEIAAIWYLREASDGDAHCMVHLGMLACRSGRFETARKWSKRAAAGANKDLFSRWLAVMLQNPEILQRVLYRMSNFGIAWWLYRKLSLRKLGFISGSSNSRLLLWLLDISENLLLPHIEVAVSGRIGKRAV